MYRFHLECVPADGESRYKIVTRWAIRTENRLAVVHTRVCLYPGKLAVIPSHRQVR